MDRADHVVFLDRRRGRPNQRLGQQRPHPGQYALPQAPVTIGADMGVHGVEQCGVVGPVHVGRGYTQRQRDHAEIIHTHRDRARCGDRAHLQRYRIEPERHGGNPKRHRFCRRGRQAAATARGTGLARPDLFHHPQIDGVCDVEQPQCHDVPGANDHACLRFFAAVSSAGSNGRRNRPVWLPGAIAIASGVPLATTMPPPSPPSGPKSRT